MHHRLAHDPSAPGGTADRAPVRSIPALAAAARLAPALAARVRRLPALAALALLATAACPGPAPAPECTTAADCEPHQNCEDQVCVPIGDPPVCDPACTGDTPVCDEITARCVACTPTEGCEGETPYCSDAGEPVCVACLEDAHCQGDPAGPFCSGGACTGEDPAGASAQIAAARAAPDGQGLSLPIQGAVVTYLRPAVGDDPAGFFLQAEQAGPALFVADDPGFFDVGDVVDLTVTGLSTASGLRQVIAYTGLQATGATVAVGPLVQDLSGAGDLVSALDDYESELVSLTGTLGAFSDAGTDHLAAPLRTAGLDDTRLQLRLPADLPAALGLEAGCTVTLAGAPMWRHFETAQPMIFAAADLTDLDCPVVETPAVLRLTEVNPNIPTSRDLVELTVLEAGTTRGVTVVEAASDETVLATFPAIQVAQGDVIVLHLNPTADDSPARSERESKTESTAAGAFPDAWDFVGGSAGVPFSHRVLMVKSGSQVQDAVVFVNPAVETPPGAFPAAVQAVQDAGLWSPADCGGAPCTYESTPSVLDVAVDWSGVPNTREGSVSRLAGQDTDSKDDWVLTETGASFGEANP